ncbi:unnamed protein product, partial [Coregonus sp. 'balchen']
AAAANQDARFLAQPLTPQEVNLTGEELDHYPPVSYSLPEASDTQFNLVKTLFLGKVFGEYRHLKRLFDR